MICTAHIALLGDLCLSILSSVLAPCDPVTTEDRNRLIANLKNLAEPAEYVVHVRRARLELHRAGSVALIDSLIAASRTGKMSDYEESLAQIWECFDDPKMWPAVWPEREYDHEHPPGVTYDIHDCGSVCRQTLRSQMGYATSILSTPSLLLDFVAQNEQLRVLPPERLSTYDSRFLMKPFGVGVATFDDYLKWSWASQAALDARDAVESRLTLVLNPDSASVTTRLSIELDQARCVPLQAVAYDLEGRAQVASAFDYNETSREGDIPQLERVVTVIYSASALSITTAEIQQRSRLDEIHGLKGHMVTVPEGTKLYDMRLDGDNAQFLGRAAGGRAFPDEIAQLVALGGVRYNESRSMEGSHSSTPGMDWRAGTIAIAACGVAAIVAGLVLCKKTRPVGSDVS